MGGHTPASPNAGAVDTEFATRGGDATPDLHDAADEIEALHVVKRSLVAKQRGTGHRHQLQPTHLPRLPSCQESACCSL
jgi:hypothetical protein